MAEWFILPLRNVFPSVVWSGPGADIHLTFDDGPHPAATPVVLEILRRYHVRATFFLVGERVQKYPEIVQAIVADGHAVGNHTYSHRSVMFRSTGKVRDEVRRCNEAILESGGPRPSMFRPPHGVFDPTPPARVRAEGCSTVLFGVNSWDFSRPHPNRIIDRIVRLTRPGDIVLFHDNDVTQDRVEHYLPGSLDGLLSRGHTISLLPS